MKRSKTVYLIIAVLLAVSVTSFSQQGGGTGGAPRYNQSGDRIVDYFDVHAADLKSVLRQLSAYSGIDIISSDAVKATVTITVSNKTWREILGIISLVHSLAVVEEQTFVYVMTKEEAAMRGIGAAAAAAAPGASGTVAEAALLSSPLIREVIPLRFTTAEEMEPTVTPFLSQRGKLTPVKHTNSLIIVDVEENVTQLRKLIEQIDIQTAQISISCKIIEVNSGVAQKMGVHWGYANANNNFTINQILGEDGGPVESILGDGMHRATFGMLSPKDFSAALEYLFADNKSEMVAQPQITTLNNREAEIFMGSQVPLLKTDESGNTVTEMQQVGTQLIVTPYVFGDGKIRLTLSPKKESFYMTDAGPIVTTQSASTNVLVNNGETVVIAGLTSNEKRDEESGIPILKSIPIIGNLFKRSSKSVDKRDLVIFVTPHIIHSGI